ncbi:MAG: hypothetical protein PHY47_20120 [Lachnospiraceae bacterium]|nr:hypothetical protein [Lachnospiraceae bacterium]
MNYLICKVNDRKQKYRKMLTMDEEIYKIPNCRAGILFKAGYSLEEDEWFVINDFSQTSYCIELLKEEFDSTKYSLAYSDKPGKISYLCSYQKKNFYCFQRVMLSNMVMRKRILRIGDEIDIRPVKHGITLQDYPDAFYRKDSDQLFFRKLESITSIFRGIQEIYREATDEEVAKFLSEDFVTVGSGYGTGKVGKANRKRLAWAVDKLRNFKPKQRKEIFEYIHEYNPQLPYKNKSFTIGSEDDLKNLVFGIDQRFYTTAVTKEPRVANSVLPLQSPV